MDSTKDMSLALSQLSNLQGLGLDTEDVEGGVNGKICLHLPALEELSIKMFRNAAIMLDCPQLKSLSLSFLTLLQAFSGTPPSLEGYEDHFSGGWCSASGEHSCIGKAGRADRTDPHRL